jgi:SAM-dependent methyltransferase
MVDELIGGGLAGNVVDFGCGDGLYLERCEASGGTSIGIDIDPEMVNATRQRVASYRGQHQVMEGGVDRLVEIESDSCDMLLALNVLAYLDDTQCNTFYHQAARILKRGGSLVVTHSNELFDMFTFNKYTAAFFKRNFNVTGLESLLVNWDKPDRLPLPTRENPLSYAFKLQRYGLLEEQQEFSIPHALPPLLDDKFDPDDLASRKVAVTQGIRPEDRWKLAFTCSIFGSRSVRV